MKQIKDTITYLPASQDPLSADVICIQGRERTWFFDVGNNEEAMRWILETKGKKSIVISHFHPDHCGNLQRLLAQNVDNEIDLYVGENTYKYTQAGTIVTEEMKILDGVELMIFPLPSSHAKGSLGLQAGEYAFLGDGTYATNKKGKVVYNAQLLREEIRVLEQLTATYFGLSHGEPLLQERAAVLEQLYRIYDKRQKSDPYIVLYE